MPCNSLPRQVTSEVCKLATARREAFVTEVERHDCITVRRDHLCARIDEIAMGLDDPLGAFEQRQRRPFRLAERSPDTPQLAAHLPLLQRQRLDPDLDRHLGRLEGVEAQHLERLERIKALQDRRFSLAAIRALLEREASGAITTPRMRRER